MTLSYIDRKAEESGTDSKYSLGAHSSSSELLCHCTAQSFYHRLKAAMFLLAQWATTSLHSCCFYVGGEMHSWEQRKAACSAPLNWIWKAHEPLWNSQVSHRSRVRCQTSNPSAPVAVSVRSGLTFICLEGRWKG